MTKLSILLLSIILIAKVSFCQKAKIDTSLYTNRAFFSHLIANHLYDEAITLLKTSTTQQQNKLLQDSNSLILANLFLSIHYFDSAHLYFKHIDSFPTIASVQKAIETAFTQNDTLAIDHYLKKYSTEIDSSTIQMYKNSLVMLHKKSLDSNAIQADSLLLDITKRYCNFVPKSAFVAGILSAVVPGLGKHYLGYKKLAKGSFYSNLFLGGIVTEVLFKTSKPLPIIAATFALSTFYIGNIWGSVLLAKKRERDFYNQINSDIKEFYQDRLSSSGNKPALIVDGNRNLKSLLLEKEFNVWKSNNAQTKGDFVIQKAQLLKKSGYFNNALNELQGIDSICVKYKTEYLYEKAINAFLIKDYNQSYNLLLDIPDSVRTQSKAITRLWLLTLIENKEWEHCKKDMLRLCDSNATTAKEIQNAPTTVLYKSPITAHRLSSYFPGLGLFYAHKPLKGITSIVIEASCIAVTTSLIVSGYYFTPIVVGLYPFLRFYGGGKELSYAKTVEYNAVKQEECKQQYQNLVWEVIK